MQAIFILAPEPSPGPARRVQKGVLELLRFCTVSARLKNITQACEPLQAQSAYDQLLYLDSRVLEEKPQPQAEPASQKKLLPGGTKSLPPLWANS